MIGGLFIYNHKGEVLISRVYRDDIGFVLLISVTLIEILTIKIYHLLKIFYN